MDKTDYILIGAGALLVLAWYRNNQGGVMSAAASNPAWFGGYGGSDQTFNPNGNVQGGAYLTRQLQRLFDVMGAPVTNSTATV